MRIRIKSDRQNLCIYLPTALILSKSVGAIVGALGKKYVPDARKDIPPETLKVIFSELRRVKRRYGTWTLVEVESTSGEMVEIIL